VDTATLPYDCVVVYQYWSSKCILHHDKKCCEYAISEMLTSGKKLSRNVWENPQITGVKLAWKPEVVDSPV